MAVYEETPVHHDHYIERDSSGVGAGFWAVIVVLAALLLLLLFGSNLFDRGTSGTNTNTDTGGATIEGQINTPSGSGSGTIETQ